MPIENHIEKQKNEDGTEKEVLSVTFSNGALEQLRELQKEFGLDDEISVIKLGISIIQKAKEDTTNKR